MTKELSFHRNAKSRPFCLRHRASCVDEQAVGAEGNNLEEAMEFLVNKAVALPIGRAKEAQKLFALQKELLELFKKGVRDIGFRQTEKGRILEEREILKNLRFRRRQELRKFAR